MHDVVAIEGRCAGASAQHIGQRPVAVRAQRALAVPDDLREDGCAVEELRRHPGPLRALAGEDEHRFAEGPSTAALDRGMGDPGVGDRVQGRQQVVPAGADEDGPVGEGGAVVSEGPGDLGGAEIRVRREVLAQTGRLGTQRFVTASRKHPGDRIACIRFSRMPR